MRSLQMVNSQVKAPAQRELPGARPDLGRSDVSQNTKVANRVCSFDGCEKPANKREWCSTHYTRWRKYGDPNAYRVDSSRGTCSVEGCGAPHMARGWCEKHYFRWRTHGDPTQVPARKTAVDNFWKVWEMVDRNTPNGCWEWTGSRARRGERAFDQIGGGL